jgi:hypothetical protein
MNQAITPNKTYLGFAFRSCLIYQTRPMNLRRTRSL